jgi:hypothetical protein
VNPSAPRDYGISGWCSLGRLRARTGWFGTRIDLLWEHEDGTREWRRYRGSITISELVDLMSEEISA